MYAHSQLAAFLTGELKLWSPIPADGLQPSEDAPNSTKDQETDQARVATSFGRSSESKVYRTILNKSVYCPD